MGFAFECDGNAFAIPEHIVAVSLSLRTSENKYTEQPLALERMYLNFPQSAHFIRHSKIYLCICKITFIY